MAKLLITGVSGLLGGNMALTAAREHEVIGVVHRHRVDLPGVDVVQADLAQPGATEALIEAQRPGWVVHCAGATQLDRCEREPAWAHALNVDMARQVAEASAAAGARLAHLSTDSVFDGEKGGYDEADEPRAINAYAESKLAGERAVAAAHPGALIVRTNFFGWNVRAKVNLAEWFLANLERGEACKGFTDVSFSPLYVDDLAGLILSLLKRGARGVFHLPGRDCVSKHAFGVRLAEAFELEASLILPASVDEMDFTARRAKRTCLNGGKSESFLGRPLPALEAGLRAFRAARKERQGVGQAHAKPRETTYESD